MQKPSSLNAALCRLMGLIPRPASSPARQACNQLRLGLFLFEGGTRGLPKDVEIV
jgi:hypothetical protein